MNKKKKRLLTIDLLFMVLLIMADQFTKYFAVANLKNHEPWVLWDGVFELHYLENRGATVIMTRSDDSELSLAGRVSLILEHKPSIFFSCLCNRNLFAFAQINL